MLCSSFVLLFWGYVGPMSDKRSDGNNHGSERRCLRFGGVDTVTTNGCEAKFTSVFWAQNIIFKRGIHEIDL